MPSLIARPANVTLQAKDTLEAIKRLVQVAKDGTTVGVKPRLNFIAGTNVALDIRDNPPGGSVDIEITVPPSSGVLADGDYGDITVSGSGSVFEIDPNVVGDIELRDSAANSVIGRASNTLGNPSDIVAATPDLPLRLNGGTLAFGAIPESSVTNLVTDLASKVPTSRQINTTAPLTGGGNLSADRTLNISDFVASGVSAARGTVPQPPVSAGVVKYLREDATWANPVGPNFPRLPLNYPFHSSTTRALVDKDCYGYYYGRSTKLLDGKVTVRYRVTTALVGTGWCELAIFTGPIVPGTSPTLTRCGYTDILTTVSTTGVKSTDITLTSSIQVDDEIWLVWAAEITGTPPTVPVFRAGDIAINDIVGFALRSSSSPRPSTVSSPSAFMAEDTTTTTEIAGLLLL